MNRFSLRFKFIVFCLSTSICMLFLSFVGTPYVYSFPRDLSKLKGNIKFLFIYDQEVKKDSFGGLTSIISSKTFVAFNKTGSYIVSDAYLPKSRVNEYFCQYDRKGNLIQMQSGTLQNDIRITLYKHRYDAYGRVIESIIYHNNETKPATTIYKYLPTSEKVIEYVDDKELNLNTRIDTQHYCNIEQEYSKFNYKKKIRYKEVDTILGKNFNKIILYNKNMDPTKIYSYNRNDSLHNIGYFEYDTNHNILCSKIYQKDKLVHKTTHSYIYDKVGNWITDSIYDDNNLTHILKRRYEYY